MSTVINSTVITDTLHLISNESPILINGILDINAGGTLVVDAGTTLLFESSSGINVNDGGQLLITGAVDNRVILKPHEEQESWAGIVFGTGSVGATYDSSTSYVSGSAIQYADIIRAGYSTSFTTHGMKLHAGSVPYILGSDMIDCGSNYGSAVDIQGLETVAVLRNLRVLKSNETQSYWPSHSLRIEGNSNDAGRVYLENLDIYADVRYNSLYAFSLERLSVTRSSLVDNVYISNIGEAEVSENNIRASLSISSIKQVVMSKNSVHGTVEVSSIKSSSEGSSIVDNSIHQGRLSYTSDYYTDNNLTVSGNTISDSTSGGLYVHNRRGSLSVYNNTIVDCKSNYDAVVHLASGPYSSGFVFSNNTVVDNSGDYIIHLQGSSGDYSTIFSENVIVGNSGSDSLIFLDDYQWSNVTLNIFDSNAAPFSVKLDMPNFDSVSLELPRNYWGDFQSDITDLRDTVYDGFDSSSQPIVDFVSVLSSPSIER